MNEIPLCPRCSVPPHCFSRPSWFPALRSSSPTAKFWFWRGCVHARAIVPLIPIDDARKGEIESEWEVAAGKHFTELTCTWTDEQRETFRHNLKNESSLKL